MNKWLLFILLLLGSAPAQSAVSGGVELKSAHSDNYNLAYGGATDFSERVNSTQTNLTWHKASSKDFVWLINAQYTDSQNSRYQHLSGSTTSLLAGVHYRFNKTNSATFKIGMREKHFDAASMSIYEDQTRIVSLKLSHRLSPNWLMNEKIVYEENFPQLDSSKYYNKIGSLWFEWNPTNSSTVSTGVIASERYYELSKAQYYFNEVYLNYAYGFARHWYVRVGVSRLKAEDDNSNTAYNQSAHFAVGVGF